MIGHLARWVRRLERLATTRRAYRFFIRQWRELGDPRAAAQVVNTMRALQLIEPVEMDGPQADRLVVVAPHPDDEMIGPGGTVLKAIARGCAVATVYLTSGRPAEAPVREAETRAVAARVGFNCTFLGAPAGAIAVDDASARRFADAVLAHRPGALMLPFLLDDHDDHRRASELLHAAWRLGLLPADLEVWAYQVYSAVLPNVVVDITGQHAAKHAAIQGYASQMAGRDWANVSLGLAAWSSRLLRGRKGAAWAEPFLVLPLAEYCRLADGYFACGRVYDHHYQSEPNGKSS